MNNAIIDKIKKLLALAENNTNESEAQNAALKAQKLIAKHNINVLELEEDYEEETIDENTLWVGEGKKWKYVLASIISKNFRCKEFWYGRKTVAFYGYKTDTEAAKEVFKFVFNVGHKLATRETNKYTNKKGIYNTYLVGFLKGLDNSFNKQSKALMIIVPKEVNESYANLSKNWGHSINGSLNTQSYHNRETLYKVYNQGVEDGSHVMGTRELKGVN